MNKSKTNLVFAVIAVLFIFGAFAGSVHAQWQNLGNGIWRDNNNLEWKNFNTRTGSFQQADNIVSNQGFRLPTHVEFQSLEGNDGIQKLGISTHRTQGYDWEARGNVVNANGGNFNSCLPISYAKSLAGGMCSSYYVIGVRNAVIGGGGGGGSGWEEKPPVTPPSSDGDGGIVNPGDDPAFLHFGENSPSVNYRLHVITLQSDENKNGKGVAPYMDNQVKELRGVLGTFKGRGIHYTLHTSKNGSAFTSKDILDYIRNTVGNGQGNNLPINSNDVIFFYYAGHAGCQVDTQEQYWGLENSDRTDNNTLYRKEVRNALKAKNARLTILISDCCSSTSLEWERDNPAARGAFLSTQQDNLAKLLSVRGLVDITSSQYRQYSIVGCFTPSLCNALRQQSTWQKVYDSTKLATEAKYRAFKESSDRKGEPQKYINGSVNEAWTLWSGYKNQTAQTPWIITPPLP